MARVQIEGVVDHLRTEMRRSLESAVEEILPDAEFDAHELYRAFLRAVRRKCGNWESVPDHLVQKD